MSYARKAAYGAGIIFIMSLLGSAAAYFMRVVLARELGPEQYGLFYSVFTVVIFALFFRDLGFPQALIKYVAEFKAQGKLGQITSAILSVLGMQLLGSILLGTIFFVAAEPLADYYFKNAEAATILRWLIVYIFGSVLFIISKDTLLGFQKTALFSLGEFLKNSLVFLLALGFLYAGFGVYAPVYAYALVCFLLFLFFFPFLLRSFPLFSVPAEHVKSVSKTMFWFALPVFATAAGSKVIGYLDTLLLTYFRSLSEVGVYNVVLPTSLLFLYLGTAVGTVVLPLASELWAKQDLRRLRTGIILVYKYIFVLAIPLAGAFLVFSSFFLGTFFGSEYLSGVLAFQILLVGVLLFLPAVVNHNIFSATGKPFLVTKIIIGSAIMNTIVNLVLIPRYGITGAALATSLSYATALVWSLYTMRKHLGVPVPWKRWGILFFMGGAYVWFLGWLFNHLPFSPLVSVAVSFILGSSSYFFILVLFKLIDIDEILRVVVGGKHGTT